MCGATPDISRIHGSHMKPLFASLANIVKYHSAHEPAGNYRYMVALP